MRQKEKDVYTRQVVYNAVKNVISSTDQADVISGRDGKLAEMITEKIGSSLDSYGIKVKKVETKLLDLSLIHI